MATTVATTTISQPPPPPPPPSSSSLTAEALNRIDLSKLTQSELNALSICTKSAHDIRRRSDNDVVIVKIDRSLFNESAGSRRQTYSRLRLRHAHHRTTRLPGLVPASSYPSTTDIEDRSVVHFLKHFLDHGVNSTPPPPPPPPRPQPQAAVLSNTPVQFELGLGLGLGFEQNVAIGNNLSEEKKKKGKGKRKLMENGVELQILNKKGEAVDFSVLESNGDDLFSEELKKRTVGLDTEEGILGFLATLEGQWCSRRKKRKYVDASEFGDSLPIGWKLILSPKRRDGHASVYIRRYISPFGQQYISCKEAASFLRSHFVHYDAKQLNDQRASSTQKVNDLAPENVSMVPRATLCASTTSDLHRSDEVSLVGIENLAEVHVQDLFECYKCNLSFDDKNAYLQHIFSFHEQTTKRVKFGKSIGEGVIIRDGKYECQFCHKVFNERRKYNGHVGVHVRNLKNPEELGVPVAENKNIESLTQEEGLALTTSRIDVSVENAGNATFETSIAALGSDLSEMTKEDCRFEEVPAQVSNQLTLEDRVGNGVTMDVDDTTNVEVFTSTESNDNDVGLAGDDLEMFGNSDHEVDFASQDDSANKSSDYDVALAVNDVEKFGNNEQEVNFASRDDSVNKSTDDDVGLAVNDVAKFGNSEQKVSFASEDDTTNISKNDYVGVAVDGVEKFGINEQKVNFASRDDTANDHTIMGTTGLIVESNVLQNEVAQSSDFFMESLDYFPGFAAASNKGENEFLVVDQNLQNATVFDELRLDGVEPFGYNFAEVQGSLSLPGASFDLENDARMEEGINSSVGFNSEGVDLNVGDQHQITTLCVWCSNEFTLDAFDSETNSDTIGYMCPVCKDRISGHLGSGFP